jgi:SAM-dependent methyltransferase
MTTVDVRSPDARAYALLAEAGLGEDLFNPRQHRSCCLVEHYTLDLASRLAADLGLVGHLDTPRTSDELCERLGFVPAFRPALAWLLEFLASANLLVRRGERYRAQGPLPAPELDALRAAVLASDPSYAPALTLLDEAAALYPRVARGETSGERALFLRVRLWLEYFSNRNGYYALNNQVAARAAAGRFRGGVILEVGAGLGSATEALLAALARSHRSVPLARYAFTEPVAFFRRHAERRLAATAAPLTFGDLDLNRPWQAQGIEGAAADLVWGVNVFHLAADLDAALAEAHAALAPGGSVVIGEGLRPAPGTPVAAEMPFQLLESYTQVSLDPRHRPDPGFLTAEQWLAALDRAGFGDVALVPDAIRLREFYPGFLAAAACGTRR